jgi:hypothetical protein
MSKHKYYAAVRWSPYDVQSLTENEHGKAAWTLAESEVWLKNNEGYIEDRLCELGFEVIRDMMPEQPNKDNYDEK